MRRSIDLNADLGERPGEGLDPVDEALLACVTSANVACGGHAGDGTTMERTIRAALRHGVAIGAHPAYPDREGFGRRVLPLTPDEVEAAVLFQIHSLDEVAQRLGAELTHVKPHGALYHQVAGHEDYAMAVALAANRFGEGLVLVGPAGSRAIEVWRSMGCGVAAEGFADRRYEGDGRLRPRALPGALLGPDEAREQGVRIACGRFVQASDGSVVPCEADTLCIHSDTPDCVLIAIEVRRGLAAADVAVLSRIRGTGASRSG